MTSLTKTSDSKTKYPSRVLTYELGFRDGRRDAVRGTKNRDSIGGGINIGPCSDEHCYLNGYHAGFIYQDHIQGINWQHYSKYQHRGLY